VPVDRVSVYYCSGIVLRRCDNDEHLFVPVTDIAHVIMETHLDAFTARFQRFVDLSPGIHIQFPGSQDVLHQAQKITFHYLKEVRPQGQPQVQVQEQVHGQG